jgi:hypothetical protein
MIYTPPQNIGERDKTMRYVFLAGSIEMGKAIDWQTDMSEFFSKNNWGVFNPRRKDWDSSWKQEFENPQFYQQVNWELDSLERADLILLYLVPETMSPISLLELGLHAADKTLCVVCPDGFWRKGNVDIVCNRYDITLFNNLEDFKKHFIEKYVQRS